MKEVNSKKNGSFIVELVAYIIAGLIGLWGLVYLVLGLIAENIDVLSSKNELLKASNTIKKLFGMGFVGWGLTLMAIGAVIAIIFLAVNAKKSDREFDREARRAARRSRLQNELATPTVATSNVGEEEIVDVEATPKEE